MNVARILYPVKVLGPGERIGIWVTGCNRGCKGCSNPELWERRPECEVSVEEIYKLICRLTESHHVDGFTISGGEPMLQAKELSELVDQIKSISDDILVYTGYQIEELRDSPDPSVTHLLSSIAVLIDGPYIEELNDNTVLRGSSNQRIHILSIAYRDVYNHYLATCHNQIQNFSTSDGIVSVGIHHPSF